MLIIGSHVSLSGDLMFEGSVEEALSYGANALMVYTGAPQNTIRKDIKTFRIKEAHQLMKENNISLNNLVVHAPYIINLANPDEEKRNFAIQFLTKEVVRTSELGSKKIVLHPGSAIGKDRPQAIKWIAEGINRVIENTKNSNVKIALETMAGKGNEIGKTFSEIKSIIDLIEDKSRICVCLDTCHIFDAGYDIINHYDEVMNEFKTIVGFEYLSVIHVNDSKNIMGSSKDRHDNIGYGNIGFDALMRVISDNRFENIPKILETPYVNGKAPYKFEIDMIKEGKFNNKLENIT